MTDRPASRTSQSSANVPATFEADSLRPYVRKLFETTLRHAEYDKDKAREFGKEISARVKSRMLEIAPQGWKFAVIITITQNLGQGGRADLATHWTAGDICIQELWSNEYLMCSCYAFAIKVR